MDPASIRGTPQVWTRRLLRCGVAAGPVFVAVFLGEGALRTRAAREDEGIALVVLIVLTVIMEVAAAPVVWMLAGGFNDVFPEQFERFLVANPHAREILLERHRDLTDPDFWRSRQARIRAGIQEDVFSYPEACRFRRQARPAGAARRRRTSACGRRD